MLAATLAATRYQPKKIRRRFFPDGSVARVSVKPGSMCGYRGSSWGGHHGLVEYRDGWARTALCLKDSVPPRTYGGFAILAIHRITRVSFNSISTCIRRNNCPHFAMNGFETNFAVQLIERKRWLCSDIVCRKAEMEPVVVSLSNH